MSDWSSDVCSSDLPVVLGGEDEELRGDAAALERGESRKTLAVGDTEILLAGDDQHRGLPFRDMIDRVPFFGVGAFPPRAAMIPFVEPELLGLERHRAQVRSEEHTSELQSLMRISYAVFCLKKKK